ncbi:MAG: AAA family ATPase [Planctomycetota bacterium]
MTRPKKKARARQVTRAQGGGADGFDFLRDRPSDHVLSADRLRWVCPPIRPSRTPPRATRLLGQERPMRALRTGLSLRAPGYNVFVSGLVGSGRTTVVRHLLHEMRPACRPGPDRVYVNNFDETHRPRLIALPRGKAPAFRDELDEFLRALHDALIDVLRSRQHKTSRRMLMREAERRERRLTDAVEHEARRAGCAVVAFTDEHGCTHRDVQPLIEGEPTSAERLQDMVADGRVGRRVADRLLARREELLERMEEAIERVRRVRRQVDHELRRVDRTGARRVMDRTVADFVRRWPQDGVRDYLRRAVLHIERNLENWAVPDEVGEPVDAGDGPPPSPQETAALRALELGAHVIKTSSDDTCPIIVETNPTYQNLFGTIELRDGEPSRLRGIHPGALVRADGGFLVLRLADVLAEPGVWRQLKRALMSGSVELREFDPNAGTTAGPLQPEAIPIDLKVVLIGEPGTYEHLAHEDPQFQQHFKVHAEFDASIAVNPENLRRYADFIRWLAGNEGLCGFGPDACAAVAEHGARVAGRRDRLTTQFGDLADLAREASYVAEEDGGSTVRARHVVAALRQRTYRHDLVRELAERDFSEGYLLLRTSGKVVGQINGLTVLDTGNLVFGKPCRISAATGAANDNGAGLINIEREAELSGALHDKGVLILEGFLLDHFGSEGPIRLKATICFEQTYSGVDGDSASSVELIALLSSLARVPLEQGIALTGSINQRGELQAVGSVNEKVESFFRLCRARRLTGRQGVILPRANVPDLMLEPEVVEAVRDGKFNVFAVDTVLAALEILTGEPAEESMAKAAATLRRYRGVP